MISRMPTLDIKDQRQREARDRLAKAEQEEHLSAIYQEFTSLILRDEGAAAALEAASRSTRPALLQQDLRVMLRGFVDSLQAEVKQGEVKMTALFRGRTQALASEIVRDGRLAAAGHDKTGSDVEYTDNEPDEDKEVDSDDEDLGARDLRTESIDTTRFLSLAGSSVAFRILLNQIYDYGFFSLTTRLINIPSRTKRSDPHADRILSELLYAQPSVLHVSTDEPSFVDSAKLTVEAVSGSAWDWWPLAPVKRKLSEKQIRIEWRCVSPDARCATRRY